MSARRKNVVDLDDVDITLAERRELRVLAANVREDRLRGLLFKLLESTDEGDDAVEADED